MNDEYRELFVMYGNEDEHSKLILDLKLPQFHTGEHTEQPKLSHTETLLSLNQL